MRVKAATIVLLLLVLFQMTQHHCHAEEKAASEAPSIHQKIYYFEHRLLPHWTYDSQGAFFDDLMNDRIDHFIATATKVVGEEFSKKITIRKYPKSNGLLMTFGTPGKLTFGVTVKKVEGGFKFFTYEKTVDFFGKGDKGVVGTWSKDNEHGNLGARKYEDAERDCGRGSKGTIDLRATTGKAPTKPTELGTKRVQRIKSRG